MKVHNGGAITAICKHLSNPYHDDLFASSSYTFIYFVVDLLADVSNPIPDLIDSSLAFGVYVFRFAVLDS